jgi:hypothetical protein
MDRITQDQLRKTFLTAHSGTCISLYMPAHRSGRETEQNPIRFKNLLRQAEEQMLDKGLSSSQVEALLKEPQRLLADPMYWQYQSDGLAMFCAEDHFHCFRLPVGFAELVVIADRFHIKPLLRLIASDGIFYILAISQNRLRLLQGTRHSVNELDLGDTPQRLSEAFPDDSPEKQLQFHTGSSVGSGDRSAMFHGHEISNELKNRIQQWFRSIDKRLRDLLPDKQSPLVLAGVGTLFPLYKDVNSYPHLMNEGVPGNPAGMKMEELQQKAWKIVEPVFEKKRAAAYDRYHQLAGTGQTTSEVTDAVVSAHHGRVEALFVAVGVQVWGAYDSNTDRVVIHESPKPGDGDLLDLSAIRTLINGGEVYAVAPEEVPDRALVAAVLRY